ncbi:30S ribosomal protein S2 [bacterium]|nr:30S ribosomal protein S2 [bacterium]
MTEVSIKEMIDAGSHFGHQTKRWNPKMKPYLYGVRSGIHIIDLQQTLSMAKNAFKTVEDVVASGKGVLFVGTKAQAQPVIEEQAKRAGMPYITRRWLGGLLTNFSTIRKSVDRLIEMETRRENNDFAGYTKKEILDIDRDITKMLESLGGIKGMKGLPGAIFVVDPHIEKIAVHEANLLGIPVMAIADSNCDPDPIDYLIPANDDALKSIEVFAKRIADACLAGIERRQAEIKKDEEADADRPKKRPSRKAQAVEGKGRAYVGKLNEVVSEDVTAFAKATVQAAPKEAAITTDGGDEE